MRLASTVLIALRALRRNKLRSILTALGIIIGVGAVITMVSIGNGAKSMVEAQIASLGQNIVLVNSGSINQGGARSGGFGAATLTTEDADAIARDVTNVVSASPEVRSNSQIVANGLNWSTSIIGESSTYLDIRQWPLAEGSMFTEQDVRTVGKVCVIGQTIADQLFPDGDPIGQVIRFKNQPFKVMGVLTPKGLSVQGTDQDDLVIIPYTSSMKRISKQTMLRTVNVQTVSAGTLASVQNDIIALLRQRHHTTPATDDFMVRNQEEIAQAATNTSRTMTLLLGGVAAVSLLVGGIGIMNIMLVSVTERTREIGIRLAIGAHGSDVLLQFLIESVVLSLMGGILGVVLGVGGSELLARLNNWPTQVSPMAIAVAVLFSAAVGIFFGFYPARKAARLDPIEALRFE